MTKILGLDLGTNSVGWAIRDIETENQNQIIDYGVVVFKKGVGDGKSGEFSLAAERRKNRSKRRLYNAKRYRKWELLKLLIENKMCPLTEEELKLWSVGDWKKGEKNKGRKYPMSPDFTRWLAMDFDKIGSKYEDGEKLKPEFENPYLLRCFLWENDADTSQKRKYQIGRALYHLAQRRGFKTSRKSGKSSYAENKEIEEKKKENASYHIATDALAKLNSGQRFRANGVIQRKYYEEEFLAICKKQNIDNALARKLFDAVYKVRPLRTQKGLVGKCTLEKGKTRIPISHPAFEEYRALAFINNIQWRETGSKKIFETIPLDLKKKIFEELFFRQSKSYFPFEEIVKRFSENFKYEFNYAKYKDEKPELKEKKKIADLLKANPSVSACSVIAGLMNVFDEEWKDKFITNEDRFGINWTGLLLEYTVQYRNKKGANRKLGYEEIWHLLFDFIQTRDKAGEFDESAADEKDTLKKFCQDVLEWNDEKTKQFCEISIQQGYGSLSKNAIGKIIPYLQEGNIYSEAVSYANLSKVLGKEKFLAEKEAIKKVISNTIKKVGKEKDKLNIVNGLIQKYFGELEINKAKGLDEKIIEAAKTDVAQKLKGNFGEQNWNDKPETEKKEYFNFVLEKYSTFLDGKQKPNEKASSRQGKNPEIDYYKLPRLDEAIKQTLRENFSATDEELKHLYHPSDIDTYPKAKKTIDVADESTGEITKVPQLESPQPPSKGWKNPMAMRTMYELKKLVNYLLKTGKIDEETKIVIEMARELNDANKRWAIQTYQKRREDQNKEFAKAILGVAKEKYPNLNENDADNIDKVRLWWEQLENGDEIYKQVKELKEDVQKYRLWKEQQCMCIYTGKMFSITDLFDGTKTHFEHTFPLSDSFDNSLANLTVCDAHYNMNVKKDRIPTQLENYKTDSNGYTAIEPRLQKWKDKAEHLRNLIEENKIRTKKIQDIQAKNESIQKRHLLQFNFDYWDKKVKAFTLQEIPNWWKNSQLVDTQIITKYARAYMKSLFQRVDVLKARQNANDSQDGMVNIFKKIYEIKGDEQKDRSRHSHHAMDAAVLTLIPGSARREETLKQYYRDKEQQKKFHDKPYPDFDITHILSIDENVLINHISRDKTLTPTVKKVRKRGKVQFFKDGNESATFRIMQGDSIRGQLHKETFFGAVKVPERNEQGYPIRENGKFKTKEYELWIVSRKPIADINIEKDEIVDELLKRHIQLQLANGTAISNVKDFQGKPIRHLRCRVKAGRGFLTKEKAIELKQHSHLSKQEHKQTVLAQNEENYLYLFYEEDGDKKMQRAARIINLFDFRNYGFSGIREIWNDNAFNQTEKGIPLKHIIKVGKKAIFYTESKEELKELEEKELKKRVFVVYKFNESGTPDIYLKNNIDARPNPEIDKLCENSFVPNKYQAGLSLKVAKLNCVFEGKDFKIKPDGEIIWKF